MTNPLKFNLRFLLFFLFIPFDMEAQETSVSISGKIKEKESGKAMPYATIVLKHESDSTFVSGTISNENGFFTFNKIKEGEYFLEASVIGFIPFRENLFVGSNSAFLDLGTIEMEVQAELMDEVVITARQDAVSGQLDKQTYSLEDIVNQSGGSVLQSMQSLPGVGTKEGNLALRGSDQVVVLIDGKQTAITGFGGQNGLENIPASAVEKIEIIYNPSAKYDANGNAGIINIIMKDDAKKGFNGQVGLTTGVGALWVREENLPGIRPQYVATPKLNPSLLLNYRKEKLNFFIQTDNLYSETLNKNEFVTRTYTDGTVIRQQIKRNRNTNYISTRGGMDWFLSENSSLTVSGFFSQESIMDRGDQPFFSDQSDEMLRLWQFLEDEVLTATMGSLAFEQKFQAPGHNLNIGVNYTFDREDEKYFFVNTLPTFTSEESFFLIADQQVLDINLDYSRPLKHGLLETGFKFRKRDIPTDMQFNPGIDSPLDIDADGEAEYREVIPAIYGNYGYAIKKFQAEIGLRVEYAKLNYDVDPDHNTYESDGYSYFQPFPNARITYSLNDRNKLSAFFNRRVRRPNEVDIRIFPKYDDAGIIKVGNPGLKPEFTNSYEVGYKNVWEKGYLYGAAYARFSKSTITRIATTVGNSDVIYTISQNAGHSSNTGLEMLISYDFSEWFSANVNLNGYYNQIDAFTVLNKYPEETTFYAEPQSGYSGNLKANAEFRFSGTFNAQLSALYYAPDIIPQGTIGSRFSLDLGVKKTVQKGRGEFFINASDILGTMVIRKEIDGTDFSYTSADYYETQVIRLGYSYKFGE